MIGEVRSFLRYGELVQNCFALCLLCNHFLTSFQLISPSIDV